MSTMLRNSYYQTMYVTTFFDNMKTQCNTFENHAKYQLCIISISATKFSLWSGVSTSDIIIYIHIYEIPFSAVFFLSSKLVPFFRHQLSLSNKIYIKIVVAYYNASVGKCDVYFQCCNQQPPCGSTTMNNSHNLSSDAFLGSSFFKSC